MNYKIILRIEITPVQYCLNIANQTVLVIGILRLNELALTLPNTNNVRFFIVVPDKREKEVIAQFKRPSFQSIQNMTYMTFSDFCSHYESICKLGKDHSILDNIAKCP